LSGTPLRVNPEWKFKTEGLTFYGRRNIIRRTNGKDDFRRRTRIAWEPGGENLSSLNKIS
jgi:hypothetical protein